MASIIHSFYLVLTMENILIHFVHGTINRGLKLHIEENECGTKSCIS